MQGLGNKLAFSWLVRTFLSCYCCLYKREEIQRSFHMLRFLMPTNLLGNCDLSHWEFLELDTLEFRRMSKLKRYLLRSLQVRNQLSKYNHLRPSIYFMASNLYKWCAFYANVLLLKQPEMRRILLFPQGIWYYFLNA